MKTIRICLWSGPRNISTALMHSFENRADCEVWDEPFYGYYLDQTGLDHPGREAVLELWPTDPHKLAALCAGPAPEGSAIFFQKHKTQHMLDGVDLTWTAKCRHAFLIRNPAEIAAAMNPASELTPEDLGSPRQRAVYEIITANTGRQWPVIESGDVLANPKGMLEALCAALGIPFDPAMLPPSGANHSADTVRLGYRYHVSQTSPHYDASIPARRARRSKPDAAIDACMPAYLALQALKISIP